MNKKTILVTGGAGYIGSYVNKLLDQSGYNTIVLDNLSSGCREAVKYGTFVKGDVGEKELLDKIFVTYKIDAVMHFAAFIDVGESVSFPGKYYRNNVVNSLTLLETMLKHDVSLMIFSSSSAVYGNPDGLERMKEDHQKSPISPYGESKLMFEKILKDVSHAHPMRYIALRYFNVAGADPERVIKNYKVQEGNLIPAALRCVKNHQSLTIFGTDYPTKDGTCIRDYIHVHDIANAHILALESLLNGASSNAYNIGNERGFSVREVISSAERITGHKISAIEGKRREGDTPILLADTQKIFCELGWKPIYKDLDKMVEDAWRALLT